MEGGAGATGGPLPRSRPRLSGLLLLRGRLLVGLSGLGAVQLPDALVELPGEVAVLAEPGLDLRSQLGALLRRQALDALQGIGHDPVALTLLRPLLADLLGQLVRQPLG